VQAKAVRKLNGDPGTYAALGYRSTTRPAVAPDEVALKDMLGTVQGQVFF
jgi:hypothetical protein